MGYPPEQFVESLDASFLCCLCQRVPRDVHQCHQCQSVFCRSCIAQHLKEDSTCPHLECRTTLTLATVTKPRVVRNILNKLRLRCQFKKEGCPVIVSLEEYDDHTSQCDSNPLKPVECPGCRVQKKEQTVKHAELEGKLKKVIDSIALLTDEVRDIKLDIANLKRSANKLQPPVPRSYKQAEAKMLPLINHVKLKHRMSERMEAAMLYVDRGHFTVDQTDAYSHAPVGRTTARSARYLRSVARCIQFMNVLEAVLVEGSRVLVMCAFPGYEAAILSLLVGASGVVVAQEDDDEYVAEMKANLQRDKPELLNSKRIVVTKRVGANNPCADYSPYDCILNNYKQDDSFDQNVYLRLLVTNGIMMHNKIETADFSAFTKMANGAAQYFDTVEAPVAQPERELGGLEPPPKWIAMQ